jgi:hypothetical protein
MQTDDDHMVSRAKVVRNDFLVVDSRDGLVAPQQASTINPESGAPVDTEEHQDFPRAFEVQNPGGVRRRPLSARVLEDRSKIDGTSCRRRETPAGSVSPRPLGLVKPWLYGVLRADRRIERADDDPRANGALR